MNKFEKWFQTINEELAAEPTINAEVAEPTVNATSSSRTDMMQDIDTIMHSLETLAAELKESLEETEDVEEIDEATGIGTGTVAAAAGAVAGAGLAARQLALWARVPGARKAQSKVNAILVKAAQLEDAVDGIEDANQKKSIENKIEALKNQAADAEEQLNTKYTSTTLQKAIAAERYKGKIEVAKIRLQGATDSQQADLKAALKNNMAKYNQTVADLKELAPKKEEPKKEEPKGQEPKSTEEPKAKEEPKAEDGAAAAAEKSKQDQIAEIEGDLAEYTKNLDVANDEIKKDQTKINKLKAEMEKSTNPESFQKDIDELTKKIQANQEDAKEIQGTRNNLRKKLASLSPRESLVIRAEDANLNELAIEISEKAEWQLDGTVLYTKYDSMIRKAEAMNYLNESRSITLKDKFSKLL